MLSPSFFISLFAATARSESPPRYTGSVAGPSVDAENEEEEEEEEEESSRKVSEDVTSSKEMKTPCIPEPVELALRVPFFTRLICMSVSIYFPNCSGLQCDATLEEILDGWNSDLINQKDRRRQVG